MKMDKRKKESLKKYSQHDLRRLMLEQKSKAAASAESAKGIKTERVDSPLAKYDAADNLSCVICRASIKSATVWKVHINSKQHKQKLEAAKQMKEKLLVPPKTSIAASAAVSMPPPSSAPAKQQQPPLRPAIKTTTTTTKANNTFETYKKEASKENIGPAALAEMAQRVEATAANAGELSDNPLPEKFFDDPMRDAKVRNTEYVDPQDQEWERFQREIKEESTMSNAIIAGEQDEAAADRQIIEIDEQMERWARVIQMEERKEKVLQRSKLRGETAGVAAKAETGNSSDEEENDSEEGGEAFDEFSDWRAKKF